MWVQLFVTREMVPAEFLKQREKSISSSKGAAFSSIHLTGFGRPSLSSSVVMENTFNGSSSGPELTHRENLVMDNPGGRDVRILFTWAQATYRSLCILEEKFWA